MRNYKNNNTKNPGAANTAAPPRPALELDVEYFEQFLEGEDISESEKQVLLETLWAIICEFIYLGYGVTGTQQASAENACGKPSQNTEMTGLPASGMVQSGHKTIVEKFISAHEDAGKE